MATIKSILNKIADLTTRIGLRSIGKSEFFQLLIDMTNKIGEVSDNVNSVAKSLIWHDPVESIVSSLPNSGLTVGKRYILSSDSKIYTATSTTAFGTGVTPELGWALMVKSLAADGNVYVYSWNGTAWKNTGLINNATVVENYGQDTAKSISQKFFTNEIINLRTDVANKIIHANEDVISGVTTQVGYIGSNGTFQASSGWKSVVKLLIISGTYTITGNFATAGAYIAFFDINGTFISSIAPNCGTSPYQFTTPTGTYFISVCATTAASPFTLVYNGASDIQINVLKDRIIAVENGLVVSNAKIADNTTKIASVLSLSVKALNLNTNVGRTDVAMFATATENTNQFGVSQVTDSDSPFAGLLANKTEFVNSQTPATNYSRYYSVPIAKFGTPKIFSYSYWVKNSEWTAMGATVFNIENKLYCNVNNGYNSISAIYDILSILNGGTKTDSVSTAGLTASYKVGLGATSGGWSQIIVTFYNMVWTIPWTYCYFYTILSSTANNNTAYIANKTWHYQNQTIVVGEEVIPVAVIYGDGGNIVANFTSMADVESLKLRATALELYHTKPNTFVYDSAIDGVSYVQSYLNSTYDFKHTFLIKRALSNDGNQNFNFNYSNLVNRSTLAETRVHNETDEISPSYFNGGYLGGNHGYSSLRIATVSGHGKTFVDIGSCWINSATGYKYYIVGIQDANNLWILGENIATNDKFNCRILPTCTLTHSSGATHTTSMVVTVSTMKWWWPGLTIHSTRIIADGNQITTSGSYKYNELLIEEVYDIPNPASTLQKIIDAVGTFSANPVYNALGAASVARHTIVYKFTDAMTCFVETNYILFQDIDIGYMAFTQQNLLQGSTIKLYVPKVLPISDGSRTYDFRTVEDFSTNPATALDITSSYWENPLLPPDRYVQTGQYAAISVGYLFDRGIGGTKRKDMVLNALNIYNSTRKLYPHGIDNKLTISANQSYSAVCFRKYLDVATIKTGNKIATTAFEYEGSYYVYADYYGVLLDEISIPDKFVGRQITVFEKSANVYLLGEIATSKLLVNVATASPMYGYLVLKIA